MIDDRINKTLSDLEVALSNIKSAKEQVENTVECFDGITGSMKKYRESLDELGSSLAIFTKFVGQDYENNIKEIEKDRKQIIESSQAVLKQVDDKSNEITRIVTKTVKSLQYKMWASIGLNVVVLGILLYKFILS